MTHLYVCHFSNGHIKVGRSIDPTARIAQHEERLSCVGIELAEHFIVECVGPSEPREAALIERCTGSAGQRFKYEWFVGLDYPTVCEWATEAAQLTGAGAKTNRWSEIVAHLKRNGYSQARLAKLCNCSTTTMNSIALGRQADPVYSVGAALVALAAEVQQPAQA